MKNYCVCLNNTFEVFIDIIDKIFASTVFNCCAFIQIHNT